MKTSQGIIFAGIVTVTLAATAPAFAVEGLGIERDCTNIVLSWPSAGYEHYLIQHRATLALETPWTILTNYYPANSTNRTTYTVYGVASPCDSGGSSLMSASKTSGATWFGPQVMQKDGSRAPVPLDLYPHGIDLSGQVILWPDGSTEDWTPELAESYAASRKLAQESFNGPQPQNGGDSGGESTVDSGFYRVFLVPDFMFDYSSYPFEHGVEFLPIELGVDPRMVVKTDLVVNGQVFRPSESGVLNLNWGTPAEPDIRPTFGVWFYNDRLTNGTYQLQLQTTLQLDGTLNHSTPYLTLTNPITTIAVSNPIVFEPWKTLMVGTSHTFKATTTVFPSDWYIDMYDAWGFWVTGTNGTTTDGNISWTWDFYDDLGNLRDAAEYDPFFDPYVTVIASSGVSEQENNPQSANTPIERPAPLSSPDYPTEGGWIIAYQDNAKHNLAARAVLNQAFSTLAGGPASLGLPNATILLKYGNTNDVGMSSDPVQNMIDRNASWDNLRNTILHPQFRNLYIYSHGSTHSIGGDWTVFKNTPNGPKPDGSDSDRNSYTVGTNKVYSTTQITSGWAWRLHHLNDGPQPYRFVFMDGCATATGDWPYPFGIIPLTNSINYFKNDDQRPNAFVGWNQSVYFNSHPLTASPEGWGGYQRFADFRTQWMMLWRYPGTTNTEELWRALDRAAQSSGWVTPQKLSEIISIYGYNDLKFNEYNHNNFTFPP
jgi:hypothetical protein